jgi:diguanylate cyclase (GGDEF)-like protein
VEYCYLIKKEFVNLHAKDVFINHLETIRLISVANRIDVYHPYVHETLRELSLSSDDKSKNALTPKEIEKLEELPSYSSECGRLQFFPNGKNSIVVKISENTAVFSSKDSVKSEGGNVDTSTTRNNIKKSRRAQIQTFKPGTWCWVTLTYTDRLPPWLQFNESKDHHSTTNHDLATLTQLLISADMQLKLVDDHTSLLSDPLSMLCSRTTLQNRLSTLGRKHSIGLVMIHCIDFHQINKKFSHDHGDKVIREITSGLKSTTREGDILSRFGGALFAIGFPTNEQDDVASLAKKLQKSLQEKQYLDGAINLNFDLGAAIIRHNEDFKTEAERASALINRADQALNSAQQEKQPSIITWQNDDYNLYQQQFQYLGGIFTADTVTDYRNMLLLWDISSIIADKHDFSQLLQSVVQRLCQTFDFVCAGLITDSDVSNKDYKHSIDSDDNAIELTEKDASFLPELVRMQANVLEKNKPSEKYINDNLFLVLPLEIQTTDCFFVCGQSEKFDVTHDTKVLLSGLTRQLGKALRRSRLEEELNRKLESQNELLQNELVQLKEGLQSSSIIYQSAAMHNLMKFTQRAAMTDTTVLVTGESGTGKERLIYALHQLGKRSDKPFVIIDCGSIPETLIESELFGHVKGAFTGAQNSANGKVMDANGGVLVLDEIGELPLQMQTKLLRFVQEKHFTRVGGNKLINVDVKIIAVTNRDLAQEVERGTFRKDLYYRLNVLTLHNPPLRDRLDDLPLLSQHFLNKFAKQFKVEKMSLSAEAVNKMRAYSWPGNIRELENRLMQATLLCDGTIINWELLNIEENIKEQIPVTHNDTSNHHQTLSTPAESNQHVNSSAHQSAAYEELSHADHSQAAPEEKLVFIDVDSCLTQLSNVLQTQITVSGQLAQFFNAPFGTWVEDELILQTYIATAKKMRLTAARLHISQSTARRRVDKIIADDEMGEAIRPDSWHQVTDALLPIANGEVVVPDCMAKLRLVILEAILNTSVCSMAQAAEILGVSEPTFYKLKKELEMTL